MIEMLAHRHFFALPWLMTRAGQIDLEGVEGEVASEWVAQLVHPLEERQVNRQLDVFAGGPRLVRLLIL
jgi:hypothetical protein